MDRLDGASISKVFFFRIAACMPNPYKVVDLDTALPPDQRDK